MRYPGVATIGNLQGNLEKPVKVKFVGRKSSSATAGTPSNIEYELDTVLEKVHLFEGIAVSSYLPDRSSMFYPFLGDGTAIQEIRSQKGELLFQNPLITAERFELSRHDAGDEKIFQRERDMLMLASFGDTYKENQAIFENKK